MPNLIEKLKEEADSIFSEAIDAVAQLINNNYTFPVMEDADTILSDYSFQQTHIDNFIEECCIIGSEYKIHTVALYERYIEFCAANGVKAISQNLFSQKINSKRTVHMPKELAEELEEYINSLYGIKSTDRLFEISKSSFHKTMTEYSRKAGVKRITIHGLRHSHISLLMNYVSCASVMDIAKRAGHKSPEITMIYSHRYGNKDALIAEQLDEMMRGDSDVGKK